MAKALRDYRSKRDFSKTNEPVGIEGVEDGNRFVVHKHSATADHYDLRLQVGDVLKCWAVPKGPSLDPDVKHLAVETEDHPIDYADFEGVIPKGQYGAGPMIVWDAGTWAPMDDIETSFKKGQFKFRLVGEKLQGGWMLARLKPRPKERQPNWLLFKERDFAADPETDILETRPESVKSGRVIEDFLISDEPKPTRPLRPGALKGAKKTPFPDRIEPQLASRVEVPARDDKWLHEIKFDGYRTMAHIRDGDARLLTRAGLDWTHRFGDLGQHLSKLPCRNAVIDGEIVVLDEKGVSRFDMLKTALSEGPETALVYFAFDLLHLNGWDLRNVPLDKRKDHLQRLLQGGAGEQAAIHFSDHVIGNGDAFFDRACEMGLEGVISKPVVSTYQSGRSKVWTKAKALLTGHFPIVGYTTSHAAEGLAALAAGEWTEEGLVYRGKIGTGFNANEAGMLLTRLEQLEDPEARLEDMPKVVVPVRPALSATVYYTGRTKTDALRHAVYKGLRETQSSTTVSAPRTRLVSDADLASVWVTNPSRRLFGKNGPTKLELAVYYAQVGDFMLPHILNRPVTLVRCPTGKQEDCFYQRHAFTGMPDTVSTFSQKSKDGEAKSYLYLDNVKGYLALAQFGVVEFHSWGALRKPIDKPDRIIFDLDPGEGVAWREIVEAAVQVREVLAGLGLVPFVKTSGGKGVHVVVPIEPKKTWKTVHAMTGKIAEAIAATAPEVFITTMSKKQRGGRIFIDFHRNYQGATAVAPYSLRARPGLPVSTPLHWDDLESVDAPQEFNYSSVPGLLEGTGDAWAEIDQAAKPLPTL